MVYKASAEGGLLVLLVHPGGPFWKNKDDGTWSIPKGELVQGEDPLSAAKREFTEETGNIITDTIFTALEPVTIKSGKVIIAFAVNAEFEKCFISSNTFEMEWPPRSGKIQVFPEVDKAAWFSIEDAAKKINVGQLPLLNQLSSLT